jgi:NADH-quinone oxidoreductase subunit F
MWLFKVLTRLEEGRGSEADLDLLLSVSDEISGKVLCALGDFSVSPVVATVKQFRDEYLAHLTEGKCPFGSWAL